MHTAIVVIKIPNLLHNDSFSQRWANFVGAAANTKSISQPIGRRAVGRKCLADKLATESKCVCSITIFRVELWIIVWNFAA